MRTYELSHRLPDGVGTNGVFTEGHKSPTLDTLQRGVQWMGGAVDWGSIIQ